LMRSARRRSLCRRPWIVAREAYPRRCQATVLSTVLVGRTGDANTIRCRPMVVATPTRTLRRKLCRGTLWSCAHRQNGFSFFSDFSSFFQSAAIVTL
jgi:hypothetical protein